MKTCNNCFLPETHETIEYDNIGVCNVCNNHKFKKKNINWSQKLLDFEKILSLYRNKNSYDCIVPFSGGKDSVFTLYTLVKRFKLKCLVVSFDHGFFRPKLVKNRNKIFKKLGVDNLTFSPNWKIVKKMMLESLIRKGDFCWHCHTGIFAYPMRIAIAFKIPLVIWGEPAAEYTAYYSYEDTLEENEEVDEERFNKFINLGISSKDMKEMINLNDVDERDFEPFTYPNLRDLKKINYRSICLGSYIPWDVKKNVELIKKELNWEEDLNAGIPPEYGYEKVECQVQGIRDYIRYLKRGYGRTAHLVAIDIRNNRITNNEGKDLIEKYDGKKPDSLPQFLEMLNLKEEEFNNIIKNHVIYPNKPNFSDLEIGPELKDKKEWSKNDPLERNYTLRKLKEHNI